MPSTGIFSLQSPRDLLTKAEHDLARLRQNEISAYAAFDFFVAIRHIPDWLFPAKADASKRDALFAAHVSLRVARHIADGAKHFQLTAKHHKQVSTTSGTQPAFQKGAFQDDAFQTGRLLVELDPQDPDTARFGSKIEALPLAEQVFADVERLVP